VRSEEGEGGKYFNVRCNRIRQFAADMPTRKFDMIDKLCAWRHDAPVRCTTDAAAQLQPIPYTCGAQRALLPIAVGSMNINELMNINDVRESATIFPRPCKLTFTFDLLTLKVVSKSRVTCATCVPILV